MRVLPVSFSFNSKTANSNIEHHFLYSASDLKPKHQSFEHFHIACGTLAVTAVIVTLFNLGAKRAPKNVFVV